MKRYHIYIFVAHPTSGLRYYLHQYLNYLSKWNQMIFHKLMQSCPVWHPGVFSSLNQPLSQSRCWGSVVLSCCFFTLDTLQHHHTIKWAQRSAARPSLTFTPRWMKSSNHTHTHSHKHLVSRSVFIRLTMLSGMKMPDEFFMLLLLLDSRHDPTYAARNDAATSNISCICAANRTGNTTRKPETYKYLYLWSAS